MPPVQCTSTWISDQDQAPPQFLLFESTDEIYRIHWEKIPSRCDVLDSSLAESIWESYCHGYQGKRHLSGPLLCRVSLSEPTHV